MKMEVEERQFTLPCGCVTITRNDRSFDVRWCPHHRMLHGVVSCNFATPSRPERRAERLR